MMAISSASGRRGRAPAPGCPAGRPAAPPASAARRRRSGSAPARPAPAAPGSAAARRFSRIEVASSSSSASSKSRRGWPGLRSHQLDRQLARAAAAGASPAAVASASSSRAESPRPSPLRCSAISRSPPARHAGSSVRRARSRPTSSRGQLEIGLAAGALQVVDQRRLAERRRLGDPHIARDHGLVDLVAEMLAHVLGHLLGQAVAPVVHGQHHALDLQRRVEAAAHQLDGPHQLGQALQREELALQRHQHRVGRGHGVDGQQVERRRAVDQHIVVAAVRRPRSGGQRVAQAERAARRLAQLQLDAGEVGGRPAAGRGRAGRSRTAASTAGAVAISTS